MTKPEIKNHIPQPPGRLTVNSKIMTYDILDSNIVIIDAEDFTQSEIDSAMDYLWEYIEG